MTTLALCKGHEALIAEARNLPDGWRGEILFKCPIYGREIPMKQIKSEMRLRLDEILHHGRLIRTTTETFEVEHAKRPAITIRCDVRKPYRG